MRQSIAILSVLAGTALAQDVVSFFFPGGTTVIYQSNFEHILTRK